MHVGQLRDAPEEIATHQIDQICTPQVISTEGLLTAPNGEYAGDAASCAPNGV